MVGQAWPAYFSCHGQDLRYQYDAAGQLIQIVDAYLGQTTRYTYDLGGRRQSEQLRQRTTLPTGDSVDVVYQDNHMVYDSLGRLHATADGHVWAFIDYDLNGNRVKTLTSVINTLNKTTGPEEDSSHVDQVTRYSFDKMNRQVSDGVHTYTYDLAGRRLTDAHGNTDTYSYDDFNRITAVKRDDVANWEIRQYDAAGRVVYSKSAAQNETTSETAESWRLMRYNQYDSLGQLSATRSVTRRDDGRRAHSTDTRYTQYDAAGNLKTTTVDTNNDANPDNTYNYQYEHYGSYKQARVSVSGNGTSASTDSWFDANGFLVATDRSESTPDKPLGNALVNDAQGRVLYNNQGAARPFDTNTAGFGRIENQAGGFIGGFIGNDSNRGHVQRQLIVNGEVLARYGDELVANGTGTEFTPTSVAEFQFGAAPLNVRQSNLDAQRYTVSDGETLRSIARSFYGDDKLWYLIAQANGLSGSTQLSTGQTLSIPKLSASSNAADSFKPYDPSKVVGDLTPNLPMPQNDKGCGALGQIIMIVVAIVVTIYTAGAMSGAAAQFGGSFMSTMQAGMGVMTGGTVGGAAGLAGYTAAATGAGVLGLTGTAAVMATGALAAGVGSVASQVVGNAIGAVDGFSWKGGGIVCPQRRYWCWNGGARGFKWAALGRRD